MSTTNAAYGNGGEPSRPAGPGAADGERGRDPRMEVLVVDADESLMERCAQIVRSEGHGCETEGEADAAVRKIDRRGFDLVLLDARLPGLNAGRVLEELRSRGEDTLVVLTTDDPSTEGSMEALRRGAWDYLPKPFSAPHLLARIGAAAFTVTQTRRIAHGADSDGILLKNGLTILGVSTALRDAVRRALRVARTDATVLLTGESGTGKELFARLVHEKSRRADETFAPVNCAAMPSQLLESEMFGHRRGAFTGAVREKPGLLETADGGTLFLDEIGEMPTSLQAKLLRVMQDGAVRRVGSEEIDSEVDVRFVSATNRDPETAVEEGHLREDLYYRLRVVPIRLPPLRERREDVPVLARHFARRSWREHRGAADGPPPRLSSAALDELTSYRWPGNVRELENMMERLMIFAEPGKELRPEDLPVTERSVDPAQGNGQGGEGGSTRLVDFRRSYHEAKEDLITRFEKEYLTRVIYRADGNVSKAARQSGVDRTTLYRLMEKHDLSRDSLPD